MGFLALQSKHTCQGVGGLYRLLVVYKDNVGHVCCTHCKHQSECCVTKPHKGLSITSIHISGSLFKKVSVKCSLYRVIQL